MEAIVYVKWEDALLWHEAREWGAGIVRTWCNKMHRFTETTTERPKDMDLCTRCRLDRQNEERKMS